MKLNAIALSAVAFLPLLLTTFPSVAQTQGRPNNTTAMSNNWSQYQKTETEFMQGCMGQQSIPANQRKIKQGYCQCAFSAYKSRYNPQTFAQINAVAVGLGQNGPLLVNLMMKPELDRCSSQTGFRR